MKNNKILLVSFLFMAAILTGEILNIVKFAGCDFDGKPNYKEEIIRGVGIVFPPVGIVAGYIDIKKGNIDR